MGLGKWGADRVGLQIAGDTTLMQLRYLSDAHVKFLPDLGVCTPDSSVSVYTRWYVLLDTTIVKISRCEVECVSNVFQE